MEEGTIPQPILPLIPKGASRINDLVSVYRDSDQWTYFVGAHPMGRHAAEDHRAFQLMTWQLIDSGSCRQSEVIRAFGMSKSSVARAVRRYRESGIKAFTASGRGRRGGTVLTKDKLAEAQRLLNDGLNRSEAAAELDVKCNTLSKAIQDGRLNGSNTTPGLDRSTRSNRDATAAVGMGTACTRTEERVLVQLGCLMALQCVSSSVGMFLSAESFAQCLPCCRMDYLTVLNVF